MPTSSLSTYLNDHVSGAKAASQVLKRLSDDSSLPGLRDYATSLHDTIQSELSVIERLLDKLDESDQSIKQRFSGLMSKVANLRFRYFSEDDLEMLESLELLRVGVFGKLGLWKALERGFKHSHFMEEIDLPILIRNAENQLRDIEHFRLQAVDLVFASETDSFRRSA